MNTVSFVKHLTNINEKLTSVLLCLEVVVQRIVGVHGGADAAREFVCVGLGRDDEPVVPEHRLCTIVERSTTFASHEEPCIRGAT